MESRREPYRVGDKFYLPYVANYMEDKSDELLTRCTVCDGVFEKNSLRIGMFVAKQSLLKSYHSDCFWHAMKQGNNAIALDEVKGIDQLLFEDQDAFVKNLTDYNKSFTKAEGVGRSMFDMATLSTTNNLKPAVDPKFLLILSRLNIHQLPSNAHVDCSKCNRPILKEKLLFTMKHDAKINFHYSCALEQASVIIGSLEDCGRFKALPPSEQSTFKQHLTRRISSTKKIGKISPLLLREVGNKTKPIIFLSTMEVFFQESSTRPCRFCKNVVQDNELCSKFNQTYCHTLCLFESGCSIIFETPESMIGYEDLGDDEKSTLQRQFEYASQETTVMTLAAKVVRRKRKAAPTEEEEQIEDAGTTELRKSQLYWSHTLHKEIKVSPLIARELLSHNEQHVKEIYAAHIIEWLVDSMMFGPPLACPDCQSRTIFYFSDVRQYCCTNYRSPLSRCTYTTKNPRRGVFVMPPVYGPILEDFKGFRTNMFTERLYAGEAPGSCRNQVIQRDFSHIKPIAKEMWTKLQKLDRDYSSNVSNFSRIYAIKNGTSVPVSSSTTFCEHQILVEDEVVYQVLLSQVDVQKNLNSITELYILESDFDSNVTFVEAKSRTGTVFRQEQKTEFVYKDPAIRKFEQTFYELTQIRWQDRHKLRTSSNGVFFVDRFNQRVKKSVGTQLGQTVREVLYDIVRVPNRLGAYMCTVECEDPIFGQLSPNAKKAALEVLNDLQEKREKKTVTSWDYLEATNTFYAMVPTYSGFESHKLLDTKEQIDKAYKRVESLLAEGQPYESLNHYQRTYDALNLTMQNVPVMTEERTRIENYMNSTVGLTHDVSVEILKVFALERPNAPHTPVAENTMLLWHGTTPSNIHSLLANGFRKPALGHLGNGKMFGYGIYFADCFSKSVMYCKNLGVCYMLLCEVAMGKMFESKVSMTQTEIDTQLAIGFDSVKGLGKHVPKKEQHLKLPEGQVIPLGTLEEQQGFVGKLLYNEYIVYEESRVKLKYLVQLKINRAQHRR